MQAGAVSEAKEQDEWKQREQSESQEQQQRAPHRFHSWLGVWHAHRMILWGERAERGSRPAYCSHRAE